MAAPVALAEQLAAVARAVAAVRQGRSLADVLPGVDARLRPGVQALTFLALRHGGETQALLALLARRAPPAPVAALLEAALALLIDAGAGYAPHTVVDQAVRALGALRTPGLAGFVNACLRRFLRERDALLARAHAGPVGRWNHPAWWVQRLQRDHPAHWAAALAADGEPAPLVLRVNRRRVSRDAYRERLAAQGWVADPIGDDGLVLAEAVPVERLPGWADGDVAVQDGAAQLAAPLLLGDGLPAGARVLDACAAPGGKTAHLLERADVTLWALDADPRRCERIHETLRRLRLPTPGAEVRVLAADAGSPADWWDGRPFDAILLDAPCSASGIVRRHPDVRWLRRGDDIARLAATQRRLLDALWPLLAPGGRLLYATCSVFRAEGADVVAAFCAAHPEAQALPAPGHLLPGGIVADPSPAAQAVVSAHAIGDNARRGMDGFFYALLRKG
ncbi:16S rRNA (cytosine(967)-C(5))-methyltransferase RsmB [Tepidimonas taiwanensis]|uniref:Ribosomal RNA small subunit methyltransferase B n=1 Tax=Tepidimonas taiwanensis TaxID=307486 RepID=A0A554X1G6_9BURK|nr:16S rRNA (cytosine(967)-C(5))-methyltransferase RsmB [Tepidimonas taiwanensis]TSE29679.1 Ribosomal RNA small subunit methyltransferase B [Tepidimonas taiwanensis]UBQ05476.1 16S rRNA (cytosine(967)-C(5))-methyltransferase RsmB [Tepidimonas taiwanensis]